MFEGGEVHTFCGVPVAVKDDGFPVDVRTVVFLLMIKDSLSKHINLQGTVATELTKVQEWPFAQSLIEKLSSSMGSSRVTLIVSSNKKPFPEGGSSRRKLGLG